ncbi:hypothetical protein FRB99_007413 [Tulasnella sp. 403]|nr:hypothetical protein FRB99_007413 [Tulasnella sp. 403]
MSKAPGIPLHRQYHHFSPDTQRKFFTNLARIIITLFSHRFPMIGSLYQHPLHPSPLSRAAPGTSQYKFRVGPIISWPFFGGGRGERNDIPRGPWPSERTYLLACAQREIQEVRREGEGRVQAHRPHLPPEDAESSSEEETGVASLSRIGSAIAIKGGVGPSHIGQQHVGHPHLAGGSIPMSQTNSIASSSLRNQLRRPGNRRHHSHRGAGLTSIVHSVAPSADPSDEEVSSSSDDDVYSYQDYRSHFRSSLLVAHQEARVANVRKDFDTFIQYMTETLGVDDRDEEFREFALDLHDLSTSNIFVDPDDLGRITCIIDWESTVIRPLWQCAHLPSFLASDPNSPEASLFRQIIAEVGSTSPHSQGCVPNGHVEPGVAKSPAPPPTSGPGPAVQSNTPVSSSADVTPPLPLTPKVLQAEAQRWLKGEREREPWRTAHKVVEWDGWEDGLVGMILGNAVGVKLPAETPHNGFVGGVRNDVAMMRFDDY